MENGTLGENVRNKTTPFKGTPWFEKWYFNKLGPRGFYNTFFCFWMKCVENGTLGGNKI